MDPLAVYLAIYRPQQHAVASGYSTMANTRAGRKRGGKWNLVRKAERIVCLCSESFKEVAMIL